MYYGSVKYPLMMTMKIDFLSMKTRGKSLLITIDQILFSFANEAFIGNVILR